MWDGRRILPAGWVRARPRAMRAMSRRSWDYGYQWWLTRRGDVDIWAGRGFGGQLLIVIPARDLVAVAYAWNVFGTPARGIFGPLLDAVLATTASRQGSPNGESQAEVHEREPLVAVEQPAQIGQLRARYVYRKPSKGWSRNVQCQQNVRGGYGLVETPLRIGARIVR